MEIIDAQVHAYERDHPGRPWVGTLAGPPEVTGDDMVAAMDEVGVDRAILVSPWSMYRTDASYAVDVYAKHPDRFRLVAPVDPLADGVADAVTTWAATPGAVGIRLMDWADIPFGAEDPGVVGAVRAAEGAGLPISMLSWGRLGLVADLARRHPGAQFVVDHLGLRQPMQPPPPADPFADLPDVLALAQHPNVAVKITGAATLSRQPFPFDDLWEPLGRVLDAFGVDRCMWGTDWTRATALVSYAEAVAAFRDSWPLAADEKAAVMGGTLKRIFGWSTSADDRTG